MKWMGIVVLWLTIGGYFSIIHSGEEITEGYPESPRGKKVGQSEGLENKDTEKLASSYWSYDYPNGPPDNYSDLPISISMEE